MAGENGNANHKFAGINVSHSPPVLVHPAGEFQAGGATTYFLSNLDQNLPVIMKTIYCFPATDRMSTEKVGEILRESLKKVLAHFYPFNGRFAVSEDGKLVVRMNGGGVPFVEAAADCVLEELAENSDQKPEELCKLVYSPPTENIFEVPLLTAQVTRFKCGGFVLGMAMSHSMADGISTVEFLHAWAEIARGLPLSQPPFLNRSLLTSRIPPAPEFAHPEFAELADSITAPSMFSALPIVHRRFTFDADKLSRLKHLATAADSHGPPPSSFAALAGLVWRARTKSLNTPPTDTIKLLFAVDCRNRIEPPLPAGFYGNGVVFACCICPAGELADRPLDHAVRMVQSANRNVTDRHIRSAIDYFEATRSRPSLAGTLVLTDWTRLGFGATDFGWGRAAQTGPSELPDREVALFLPRGEGCKGTVLVIGLPAPAMSAFEKMIEF